MSGVSKKRSHDAPPHMAKKPRVSEPKSDERKAAPRAAPSFTSALKEEETDFPRGGGSSLTALELKSIQAEGRREADEEAKAESSKSQKKGRQVSERQAKRLKKAEVIERNKERDKDNIRVEQLNYKRLTPGTHLLTRIHSILPLHLVLSLPNNLLAHVPITEISSTLTSLLEAEEAESSDGSAEDGESSDDKSAPDLLTLFKPGQYFTAKVINLFPTASQTFISQYPVSETIRLAARVEMSIMPEKVNSEIAKADVIKGYTLVGEVKAEEDKGWIVKLGLNADEGLGAVEGWLSKEEVEKSSPSKTLIVGQLVPCTIESSTAGGRVLQLSLDHQTYSRAQLSEVSTVGSLLPGHLVSALITAVVPSGLNVKVCGFFDGTMDLAHLGLGEADIEETYKIGKKIKARIIYDSLSSTPRHFALSALPHIIDLATPTSKDGSTPIEEAIPIGKVLQSVQVVRVIPEWGVVCRTDDGLDAFVHISHLSDDRLAALSTGTSQYKAGTLHRARVIGHSPLDGVLLLSFEQKILDQVFMNVDELSVGQLMKGTISRLSDKGLFVNVQGSVDGVVWPNHYADIRLKHPEKRFKVGSTVRCRVFALEPARNRVVLTLKKTLVDSTFEMPSSFDDVKVGLITPAVVTKILEKGCLVDLFGGLRAYVPQSEASANFVTNLGDIFFVGKPVTVRVTEVRQAEQRIIVSVRQALPTALAAEALEVGTTVKGQVTQIHQEQIIVLLTPSNLTALLSLSNLSNHRHMGVDELRSSLKVGEKLDELVVVSKNPTNGLLIVANKTATKVGSGISRMALSIDDIQPGQIVPGRVISYTPQGTMIQLSNALRGRIHPLDVADDLETVSTGDGPLKVDDNVMCFVLKSNPATRIIDLSTRKSRVQPDDAPEVVDREIGSLQDLKAGAKVRGLVKNVSSGGVFVSLGRNVTARIMIKELFDDFVKDWQAHFQVNQLVSGKVLSIDEKRNQVEMTLRKKPSTSSAAKKTVQLGLSDFTEGQKVVAVVKKVEAYGMFLRIEGSEVSGLCHKSEISDNKKQDVAQALRGFREGDQVKAKITSLDLEKGKINFGIKASYFADEDFEGEDGDEEEESGEEEEAAEEDEGEGSDEEMEEGDSEIEDGEEESDDEMDIDIREPASAPRIVPSKTAKKSTASSSTALSVATGFDWTGNASEDDSEPESESSDSETEVYKPTKSNSTKKSKTIDLTATAPDDIQPSSTSEYERALLASPNSSYLWIQYMSFHLQLHEIDKARSIGRKAIEKISYREEEEKLNVWMALVNLEIGFGNESSMDKVFKEAAGYNDAKTVWYRYAEALVAAGKEDIAEEVYKKMVKKFSAFSESWTRFADFYLKKGDVDAARALLPRSLKSLDKSKHVETIEKMAVLEFKHGDSERGKTLFEGIVDRYPKRLDLWNVYIDQMTKTEDIASVRSLFDRALDQKLTSKKAKFLFKKWLSIETRIGDAAGQEKAKERAKAWVMANVKAGEE